MTCRAVTRRFVLMHWASRVDLHGKADTMDWPGRNQWQNNTMSSASLNVLEPHSLGSRSLAPAGSSPCHGSSGAGILQFQYISPNDTGATIYQSRSSRNKVCSQFLRVSISLQALMMKVHTKLRSFHSSSPNLMEHTMRVLLPWMSESSFFQTTLHSQFLFGSLLIAPKARTLHSSIHIC